MTRVTALPRTRHAIERSDLNVDRGVKASERSSGGTWVCIPTYNERENVARVVERIFTSLRAAVQIVFVDDDSPDGTGRVLDALAQRDSRIHVIHRAGKLGLASAYRAAFEYALAEDAELVIQMDADLSHDPTDLPRLLAAARTADVVVGSRYVVGGETENWSRARRLLSRLGASYARITLGLRHRDLLSGFKCFRQDALRDVLSQPFAIEGYGFQAETTYRATRSGWRVAEVPITFRERATGKSKMGIGIAIEALQRLPSLRLRNVASQVHRDPPVGHAMKRSARFVGAGMVGAIAGFAVLFACVEVADVSAHIAFLISSVVSFEVNFLLNDRFTWRDRDTGKSRLKRRLLFHAGRWGAYVPAQALFSALVLAGVSYPLATVVVVALSSAFNYLVSDRLVFRCRKASTGDAGGAGPYGKVASRTAGATALPTVSVVIPVRDSAATLGKAVQSILSQDYRGHVELIVVGSMGDTSWEAVRTEIAAGSILAYEVDVDAAGRDTTVKRTYGFDRARGAVFCSVDSDTVLPSDWLRRGVATLAEGWDGAAGPYASVDGDFWGNYVDENPVASKTPRMDPAYVFDAAAIGRRGVKPPVTGNVLFTRALYQAVGGFDKDFVYHYDDYEFFQRAAEGGFRIICRSDLAIGVHHRSSLRGLLKEYWESGAGCAQFVRKFPASPFSKSRVRQLVAVGAVAAAVIVEPVIGLAVATIGAAVLGVALALVLRRPSAAFYPLITLVLGLVFASAMAVRLSLGWTYARPTRVGGSRRVEEIAPVGAST